MKEQELRKILSTNIKLFRNRKEWSQAKLAEKLKISSNFLSEIETGKGWVSPLTLVKLANALDIEVYELFKPQIPATNDETDAILRRFAQDLSVALNQSITRTVQQSLNKTLLNSLNESLRNVFEHYISNP
jgi:transcriptional regulator with XRE-family HTH domain